MNPIKRLPAPPASPSAQGKPGRRFGFNIGFSSGFYIALSILLLVTGTGWGQGWKWLTGSVLQGVKMVGNHAWAVGSQGLILHSSDGGNTWEMQDSNTPQNLNSVTFSNERHGWAVGEGVILKTTNSGITWINLPLPRPWVYYRAYSVDSMHCVMTAWTDSVMRTTDGGNTFSVHQVSGVNTYFVGITFTDSLRGWTVAGIGVLFISHTTDGGITWTNRMPGFGEAQDITMLDTLVGWAVGGGEIFHTNDGWNNVTSQTSGTTAIFQAVSFSSRTEGIIAGGHNGNLATLIWTTNGGNTWNKNTNLTQNRTYHGASMRDSTTGIIAGESGALILTADAGQTWRIVRNTDIGYTSLLNGYFTDANRGWAVGTYGVISHTINGGTIWRRQTSGVSSFLYGVSFADSQYGKICTDGGGVLGTRNEGTTWAGESTRATSPLWSIDYPDTSFAVAVGGYYGPFDSSTVRRLDGSTVTEVPPVKRLEMLKQVSRIEFGTGRHDEEKGIRNDTLPLKETSLDCCKRQGRQEGANPTAAYRTITRTTNGGATWIARNTSETPLYGVKFITRNHGWACGDGGTVLHTTDLGATWQSQPTGVTNGLYGITFKDTLHGWTCGSGGRVLWTTNGGNTWNIGNSGVTQYLNSIAFTDTLTGFAVSDNGLIIRSTDGGRNWVPDTSKCYANLTAVCALDSTHVWTVGSFGMVLGWGEAGVTGMEQGSTGAGGQGRKDIGLGQSYPNPTRGIASFEYELGKAGKVRVRVYNVAGQLVRTLVDSWETVEGPDKQHRDLRYASTGRHVVTWDGRDASGRKAGSGTYFYCLEAGDRKATRKMVIIK